VHALAQVAHLDVSTNLAADPLVRRLNDELPADINILAAIVVPHRFHARHDAVARQYVYQVARRRTAFAKPYVWWVKEPLDVDRIRQAARSFIGLRDFKSFAAGAAVGSRENDDDSEEAAGASTLVMLERLDVVEQGGLVLIVVEGSHFLWKMVRRIVGVLVEIGRGGLDAAAAPELIAGSSNLPARLTAPPSGLFLSRVYYKGDDREEPARAATLLA
jgi:tRNA pseudouridine38-40 synthase